MFFIAVTFPVKSVIICLQRRLKSRRALHIAASANIEKLKEEYIYKKPEKYTTNVLHVE